MSGKGMALPLVLLVLVLVGTFTLTLVGSFRQSQFMESHIRYGEVLRDIAYSVSDEAFWQIDQDLRNRGPFSRWMIEGGQEPPELSLAAIPLLAKSAVILKSGFETEVKVEPRLLDCCSHTPPGDPPVVFYGKERFGSLELSVELALKKPGPAPIPPLARCRLVRRFDFRVICMLPGEHQAERRGYSGGQLLDYALFVRNGLAEFSETGGSSLNPGKPIEVKIIQPAQDGSCPGKVFLGDMRQSFVQEKDEVMFLNTEEEDVQPEAAGPKGGDGPWLVPGFLETFNIGWSDLGQLFPRTFSQFPQPGDAQAVTGNFALFVSPTFLPPGDPKDVLRECARRNLQQLASQAPHPSGRNLNQRIHFPSDGKLFEGRIRKRFLRGAGFTLTVSDAPIRGSIEWNDAAFFVFPTSSEMHPCAPGMQSSSRVWQEYDQAVSAFDKTVRGKGVPSVISAFESGYSFPDTRKPAISSRKTPDEFFAVPSVKVDPLAVDSQAFPRLFDNAGNAATDTACIENLRPYWNGHLWDREFDQPVEIEESGLYSRESGLLQLHGVVWIRNGTLQLRGKDGPLQIRGSGVIIVPNIEILSGIRCEEGERGPAVFFALRSMEIDTDQRIQASLVCANSRGQANFALRRPLDLVGSLVVDRLCTHNWTQGVHTITYDSKLQPGAPCYQAVLTPRLTFERLFEE